MQHSATDFIDNAVVERGTAIYMPAVFRAKIYISRLICATRRRQRKANLTSVVYMYVREHYGEIGRRCAERVYLIEWKFDLSPLVGWKLLLPATHTYMRKYRIYFNFMRPQNRSKFFLKARTFGTRFFFFLMVQNMREKSCTIKNVFVSLFFKGWKFSRIWQKSPFFKPQPFSLETLYSKLQKKSFHSLFWKLKNVDSFKSYKNLKLNVKVA